MRRRLALAAALAGVLCMAAAADDPADRLHDPGQEAHARRLFERFRCVVCQNESIDDSEADLARDLRQIIRQQVAAGRDDAQITRFMVDRYGEFILLEPRFSLGNAALWLTPVMIVLVGGALFAVRGRRTVGLEPALTSDEEAKLGEIAFGGDFGAIPSKIGPRASPGVTER